jgi:phospholipid-binding lipoprotein MlaA
MKVWRRLAIVAVAAGILAACGSTATGPIEPPRFTLDDLRPEDAISPLLVYDPIEPVNRSIYTFNAGFDRYVFLPVVNAYETVLPVFVRNRIADFFINLNEFRNFTNSVLQLKSERAGRAALRFIINVMFGFGGLYDIAGAKGISPEPEDFGETLGYWGAGPGPYLVVPILGPSNLRDGTGNVVDAVAFSLVVPPALKGSVTQIAYYVANYGLRPIDIRSQIAFRYYGTGSPFEYDLVRFLYTEKRRLDIEK